ncbi:hypothetical protein B0H19DRAFT_1245939 [Mycena capillaripes]|nr:hypothetical protein B0H19DRAFT_1245939 [Mycena capillaripes]
MSYSQTPTDGEEGYQPVANMANSIDIQNSAADNLIQVDNKTIYKIHVSMLEEISTVMHSIFSIPDGKEDNDPTREGTEMFPLFIPGTTVVEFDDFLQWLYRAEWKDLGSNNAECERICTHLLKLADKWDIDAAKTHTIKILQKMTLAPSRCLRLAGMFTIDEWVEPAVTEILSNKLTALTYNDVEDLGLRVYVLLVKAQDLLETENRRTALVPLEMVKDPAWQCQNHTSCQRVWSKIWFEQIGRKLLHPNSPMLLVNLQCWTN